MKKSILCLWALMQFQLLSAQQSIGIGTTSPNNSALLDLTSNSKGFLVPRMTGVQRAAIASPAVGLIVYQTNTEAVPPSSPGFYIYEQAGAFGIWKRIAKAEEVTGGSSTWTINGTDQYSNLAGNVGIGIGAPLSKFHLVGNLLQDNGTITMNNPTGILQFQNAGISKTYVQLSGDNLRMGTNSGNNLGKIIFRMDGSDKIMIDSTGNLQILGEQDVSLTEPGYLTLGSTSGTNMAIDNNEIMARNNGSSANLILQNNLGNVGIGAVGIPNEKLDVAGSLKLTGGARLIKFETSQASAGILKFAPGISFIRSDNSPLGRIEYVDTFNVSNFMRLRMEGNSAVGLTINTGNDVGIGTVNPQARLHVLGGSDETIRITSLTPSIQFTDGVPAQNKKGFIDLSGNDFRIGTNTENNTGNFIIRVNGLNTVYINPSGNLSIGTSSVATGYKVSIAGKVMCEELKVQLRPWADYVFTDNYPLMNLYEVEEFIKTYKHLPNIPTAKEIEADGLQVGDMQRRMMEKIEELTLYIISLKKEMDSLKEQKK